MTDDVKYYGRIIGKNLKRIAYEHGKTQADIARDLKISKSTVSSWMNGKRVPRMKTIDLLCHYFNCKREDIMEEHDTGIKAEIKATVIPSVVVDVLRSKYSPQLLEYAMMLKKMCDMENEL